MFSQQTEQLYVLFFILSVCCFFLSFIFYSLVHEQCKKIPFYKSFGLSINIFMYRCEYTYRQIKAKSGNKCGE